MNLLAKQRTLLIGCIIVLIVAIIEGVYAVQLNRIYYSQFAPFFDSVDYHNLMAIVIETVRKRSFWEGLIAIQSTVFLPFFEGAILGLVARPSREIGIWLQVLWLAVLGISIFYYFYRFYFKKLTPSVALTLPFMGIAALWQFEGGLSDFRMDLHLYLLFSLTMIWFLMTRYSSQIHLWILVGFFAGLTCLARATAPIYLVVALAPILAVRLIKSNRTERVRLLKRILLMAGIWLLTAGWFYIANFKGLYYYYVVWNVDASANLPIQQSIHHFHNAVTSMGWFPPVLAAMLLPFTLGLCLKEKNLPRIVRNLDWEVLWIGAAPVAFLVLKGAGLNPFVSMPAVFGFILFLLKPFTAELNPLRSLLRPSRSLLIGVMSVGLLILSALSGIQNHLYPVGIERGSMKAHKQAIETIIQDASARNDPQITLVIPYVGMLTSNNIWNVFVYDTSIQPKSLNGGVLDRFVINNFFALSAPADWKQVPGETDQQKIEHLIKQARQESDYIIVPTQASISFSEKYVGWVVINNYTRILVQRFLEQKWQPIGNPIQVTSFEEVQIYRNPSSKRSTS